MARAKASSPIGPIDTLVNILRRVNDKGEENVECSRVSWRQEQLTAWDHNLDSRVVNASNDPKTSADAGDASPGEGAANEQLGLLDGAKKKKKD